MEEKAKLSDHVVTAEIAFKLRKIGFNEDVIAGWTDISNLEHSEYVTFYPNQKIIKAPTWLQAIDYLDKNFKIKIELNISSTTGKYKYAIRYFNPNNKIVMWERVLSSK